MKDETNGTARGRREPWLDRWSRGWRGAVLVTALVTVTPSAAVVTGALYGYYTTLWELRANPLPEEPEDPWQEPVRTPG